MSFIVFLFPPDFIFSWSDGDFCQNWGWILRWIWCCCGCGNMWWSRKLLSNSGAWQPRKRSAERTNWCLFRLSPFRLFSGETCHCLLMLCCNHFLSLRKPLILLVNGPLSWNWKTTRMHTTPGTSTGSEYRQWTTRTSRSSSTATWASGFNVVAAWATQ